MRKAQSYQEPTTQNTQLRISNVSGSYELQRPIRLSTDVDLFQLKTPQPLFEINQLGNTQKPILAKQQLIPAVERANNNENYAIKSLNINQDQNATHTLHQKPSQKQLTSRASKKNLQQCCSSRPSFNPLRMSQNCRRSSEEFEGLLFTKHLKRTERNQPRGNTSYKLNFAHRSVKGCSRRPGKVNQDSFIINLNLDSSQQVNFFGICDGHGPFGHHVSGYLKNSITQINKSIDFRGKIKEQIFQSLKVVADKLAKESKIDLSNSGSTLVGCYVSSDRIYCCNVGDSRAIIGSKGQKDKAWSVWQISTDHKPSLKSEAERILKKEGRIQAAKDREGKYIGPLRVWLKNQDAPGLAMTRSFGDLITTQVGIHSQPDIIQHFLSESDRIVLIASDGVWQFLQNQDIINKLVPFYEKNQLEEACNFLQEYARVQWTSKNSGEVDDITFILIFLSHN